MHTPKYIQLKAGEKVIKSISDSSGSFGKFAVGDEGTVGKFVFGAGMQYGTFYITNLRLLFESEGGGVINDYSHRNIIKTKGRNYKSGFFGHMGNLEIFTSQSNKSRYGMGTGKELSDYLNEIFYNDDVRNNVIINAAKEREEYLDYIGAVSIYEEHGMPEEAARVRKIIAEQKKVDQTVIHGDYVDDRDTIVKDSVINRSNIGAGGSSKMQELKDLTEMKEKGLIDDDEFKQMKKEILGK